jgi:hypothetical protein
MRTASWVLLTIVGVAIVGFSLLSAVTAYHAPQRDELVPNVTLDNVALADDLRAAVRARRGTASAYSAAFGALLLAVALGPYRRGDVWCWWGILVSLSLLFLVTLLRWPTLGTERGIGSAATLLGIGVVALLLDRNRIRPQTATAPPPPAA